MDQREWVGKVLRNEHKLVIDFYLYKMDTVQVAVTCLDSSNPGALKFCPAVENMSVAWTHPSATHPISW